VSARLVALAALAVIVLGVAWLLVHNAVTATP
jgi:hypothetical protein